MWRVLRNPLLLITASIPSGAFAALGGSVILGTGHFREDCGPYCTFTTASHYYFSCNTGGCVQSVAALDVQLQNPIALFPNDNNGIIIDLPAVSKPPPKHPI